MFNVDTMSLTMTFKKYENEYRNRLNWSYIYSIQSKIMKKMVLYEKDRQNREKEIRYRNLCTENRILISRMLGKRKREILPIYWHGKYDGYVFTYNENWQSLTIMLPNNKVEKYTAEEIQFNVSNTIVEYFKLEPSELNQLVVNRIDIHCDYKYEDKEEYSIIKNILKKAPENFYTYKKRIIDDEEKGYIFKYLAVRKNNNIQNFISIQDELLEKKEDKS